MDVKSYPPDAFDSLESVAEVEEERRRLGDALGDDALRIEGIARELEGLALGWQSDMLENGEAPGEEERRRMISGLAEKMERAVSGALATAAEMHVFEAVNGVDDF